MSITTYKNQTTTMNTTIREENGVYVLYIEGRLDTSAALQMGPVVESLEDCWGHDIVLDCSAMDYISSSGLRIFLNVFKHCRSCGHKAILRHPNEVVLEIFCVGGFLQLFERE